MKQIIPSQIKSIRVTNANEEELVFDNVIEYHDTETQERVITAYHNDQVLCVVYNR